MATKKRTKRAIRPSKKDAPVGEDHQPGGDASAANPTSKQPQAVASPARKPDPHASEREAARKARKEAKENPLPTKPETPKSKVTGRPVTPKAVSVVTDDLPPPPADLDAARRRKSVAAAVANQDPIVLVLDERLRYKMEAMDRRHNEAVDRVKQPILQLFADRIKTTIQKAVDSDQACRESRRAQIECVNEIIDALAGELPKGYAITLIEGENGQARAEFAPDQVGKKLPVPEPLAKE